MQLYLAVSPDKLRQAARFTDRLAHVAYRVGPEGRLTRHNLLVSTRGGVMVLGDQEGGPIRDSAALCRDVWRECGARNYSGVLADFEASPSPDRAAFLADLGRVLSRNGRRLFVSEVYGDAAERASVLLCTALSGGVFRQRLEEARERFGQRLALDLQRLRMDFPLPCPGGEGRPLSAGELEALMDRERPSVFYSSDLCAKYFTYTRDGESHFVLFDDAATLRRKLQAGQALGIETAFLMYPEAEDLLPALFQPRRR